MGTETGEVLLKVDAFISLVGADDENTIVFTGNDIETAVIDQLIHEKDSFVEVGYLSDVKANR